MTASPGERRNEADRLLGFVREAKAAGDDCRGAGDQVPALRAALVHAALAQQNLGEQEICRQADEGTCGTWSIGARRPVVLAQLAIEVQAALRPAPGVPARRVVTAIQKLAGRPR